MSQYQLTLTKSRGARIVTELPPADAWWTVAEFSAELRVKPRWLADRCAPSWPEDDRLPHHRLDGLGVRFSPEDRAAIKARFAQEPRPAAPTTPAPIDTAKGLKGLARKRQLQGATP